MCVYAHVLCACLHVCLFDLPTIWVPLCKCVSVSPHCIISISHQIQCTLALPSYLNKAWQFNPLSIKHTHTCKCEKTSAKWKTKNGGRRNFGESSRSYNRQTYWKSVSSFKCRRESKRQIKMEQMNTEVMWSLWRLCTPPSYPLSHSSSSSSPLRCVKWCNVATTGCHMGAW